MSKANWIWCNKKGTVDVEMALFYRDFTVDAMPSSYEIVLSADTRYHLYVNGQSIRRGPMRSGKCATYCDRVDIAPFLRHGDNRIAVQVAHFTADVLRAQEHRDGPVAMIATVHGALMVQDETACFELSTDERWMCRLIDGYSVALPDAAGYANSFEIIDGHSLPTEWKQPETLPEGFFPAVILCTADNDVDCYGVQNLWQLQERTLPPLKEEVRRFSSYTRCDEAHASQWNALLQGGCATFAPHTTAFVELDAADYIIGYPVLQVQGGNHSKVSLVYSEAYGETDHQGCVRKQVRDDCSGSKKLVYTEQDVYYCAEGRQQYSPMCFHAFRFLRLEIVTQEEPLCIDDVAFLCEQYPLNVEATIGGNAAMEQIWTMSLRTMRSCIYETFMDGPFFEQMQYVMDTMLQAQCMYGITQDTTLIKKAMQDFYESQLPNGLIPCYAPSKYLQIIPCYGLYWLLMVHSYYERFGDIEGVRPYFPGIERLLGYFWRHCEMDGLYHHAQGWDFVDWVDSWRLGCPITDSRQVNLLDNYLLLYGLKTASELMSAAGRRDMAEEYREQYAWLKEAVLRAGYDREDGLFRSVTGLTEKAQHAQVFAVLSGVVENEEAQQLMKRMLQNERVVKTSLPMRYFVLRALEMTGLYSAAEELLDPWENAVHYHLLTIPETSDFVGSRSDCHAWSAIPLYEYTACYLGVQPVENGAAIRIRPVADWVPFCAGKVVTPQGVVTVSVWHTGTGCRVEAQTPQVPVYVELPSGKQVAFPRGGTIVVSDDEQ